MRLGWVLVCSLVAYGAVPVLAADENGTTDIGPSLEYRPPKPVLPEPKGPRPAPPVTMFRDTFGRFGIGRGSFDAPRDIAFGKDGRVFVLDGGNSRVQMFIGRDEFVLEWGGYGSDERRGQFKKPSAIAVVPDSCRRTGADVVLVVDTGNHRIQWFRVPCTGEPRKLPNLPVGSAGSVFEQYGRDYGDMGEDGIADGEFRSPLDLTFEDPQPEGVMVWVLDAGNERIQRFLVEYDAKAREFRLPPSFVEKISDISGERGNLRGLTSIAWARESFAYLYLLGTGCSLQKFRLDNIPALDSAWPAVAPESGLCVPARVRYDSKREYVYVLDSGNSMLSIFHKGGNFISAIRGADRAFREPRGFNVVSESGAFAVADTGNNLVQKFTLR